MSRLIQITAILSNLLMIGTAIFIAAHAYGSEVFLALLLAVPPILSIIVLYSGPDLEEVRLGRKLRKARMRRELEELEALKK